MSRVTMSTADHERIAAAIRAAEAQTSGEIYCVVSRSSGAYIFHAGLFLTLASVIASTIVAFALEWLWLSVRLPLFVLAQLAAIALCLGLVRLFPALRLLFVPRGVAYRAAHDHALRQFFAKNVHVTEARTGVLIFVSLAERYAEIIADAGINAKLPQSAWNDVVRGLVDNARHHRLADGFVEAVGQVGAHLATHFPPRGDDRNELEDHLVEL